MEELIQYYNKFNEEKRLDSRHGQVEFQVSMKYIHDVIPVDVPKEEVKILDIGAGTGQYSVALAEEGYDVTAVELVKYNLGILKSKGSSVKAMQGNALNLKKLKAETFDVTLLFGPMYHLFGQEDKKKALAEAKRVTKTGGIILVAYCMNEYGVLTYAFKEKHVGECMEEGRLTEDFHTISHKENLYDYMRIEDIDPNFAKTVKPGDIIVANKNFGCGSSREHAPLSIKCAGVSCVIAETFARIFYRNAINIGLPIIECPEAAKGIEAGDQVEVDFDSGMIYNRTKGTEFKGQAFPPFMQKIITSGGLMNYINAKDE